MAPTLTTRSLSLNYTPPALLAQKPMALLSNYTPQSTNPQNESNDSHIDDVFLVLGVVISIIVYRRERLISTYGVIIVIRRKNSTRLFTVARGNGYRGGSVRMRLRYIRRDITL
ncbi:hypothetical protein HYFRA_00010194 [Hymenoscyphus fraxineus]|uniref:Uncharacterized protein n=1 Tax=Hymenoscyphus fraxineus TaxID=746836 RepID=A0A9N9KWK5_9HELO|nr:hypothetical protein HYFRA_00010194 [Hymenoscyphus fraxineus]